MDYTKYESVSLNIPTTLLKTDNTIQIRVINLNNLRHGIHTANPFIATKNEVDAETQRDRFFRTDITLASIYTLIVINILLLAISIRRPNLDILMIFTYSVVSIFYLLSFSELPRRYYPPEILSGAIHFPLRLLQDLTLFLLFFKFLKPKKHYGRHHLEIILTSIYISSILIMVLPAISGKTQMTYHLSVIQYAAPLVALPMGYAIFQSFQVPEISERSILIPTSFILFSFQLNDLFHFWGLINTYYTVKFYIPFIVIFLIYIFLQRKIKAIKASEILAAKHLLTLQVAHDIRSPLTAINAAYENINCSPQLAQNILKTGITRLNNITNALLPGHNKPITFNPAEVIKSIIDEKDFLVNFHVIDSPLIYANKTDFERVISNLLNNSHEAKPRDNKIKIELTTTTKSVSISIKDYGPGIPKAVLTNLGKFGNTEGKSTGSGLGLAHMISFINENCGRFKINSDARGTVITLLLKIHLTPSKL